MPRRPTNIALVGEHDPGYDLHIATEESLSHSSIPLEVDVAATWISTADIEYSPSGTLAGFDGVWITPGSPYRSFAGALNAIRWARESATPLLGTCGGFQHMVLEYARNVLGYQDAEHAEHDPNASNLFVTALTCSIAGTTMAITIAPDTRAARAYDGDRVEEQYYCNFGINPDVIPKLLQGSIVVSGRDADGEIRIIELADHPYFVGTLFVPQARSSAAGPHPVVTAFLAAASPARSVR